jgi:hypothetical protein
MSLARGVPKLAAGDTPMKDSSHAVPRLQGAGTPELEYRDPRFAELDKQIAAEKEARTKALASTSGDSTPAATASSARTRKGRPGTRLLDGPAKALFNDAATAARQLKRKHHAAYDADLKTFRATVQKAHSRVFRLRPGPKPDARIAGAARERAAKASWESLYKKYIDHHSEMTEFTRILAEEGFRRKLNGYLQRHSRLRRGRVVKRTDCETGNRGR